MQRAGVLAWQIFLNYEMDVFWMKREILHKTCTSLDDLAGFIAARGYRPFAAAVVDAVFFLFFVLLFVGVCVCISISHHEVVSNNFWIAI